MNILVVVLCIAHFWSNSVYLVHSVQFSLSRSIRSNLVHFDLFWSNSVNWSISVQFGQLGLIQVIRQFGLFRSNLVHFGPLGPIQSIWSNFIHLVHLLNNEKIQVWVESIVLKTRTVQESENGPILSFNQLNYWFFWFLKLGLGVLILNLNLLKKTTLSNSFTYIFTSGSLKRYFSA